jgi:hypothetical protein
MESTGPHRREPTDEEKFAAAGAEDYLGVPISDEEFADVWTSTPDDAVEAQAAATDDTPSAEA